MYMFPQQVVPLHAPFNQINFPNPKLNTRLKNLIIQGPPPYQPRFTIKIYRQVYKIHEISKLPHSTTNQSKVSKLNQVYIYISPTPKIILQALKQTTTPPHQFLDHLPRPKYTHSTNG